MVLHCFWAFSHPWVPRGPGYLPSMAGTACCFPQCAISHHLPSPVIFHYVFSPVLCHLTSPVVSHHVPHPSARYLPSCAICFLQLGANSHCQLPLPTPIASLIMYHLPSCTISHHVPFPIVCHLPSPVFSHHVPSPILRHLPSCPISHLVASSTLCHHLHLPRTSPGQTHSPISLPPQSPSQNHVGLEKLMGNKQQTPNYVQRDTAPHWKSQPGGQAEHKRPVHPFPSAAFPCQ